MNESTPGFTAKELLENATTILACSFALFAAAAADDSESFWPQWRGPLASGVAPVADPPVNWDMEHNVRWKSPLPGRGHSTPVIWNEHVFVTAAVAVGEEMAPQFSGRPGAHDNLPVTRRHQFVVIALDRRTGAIRWQQAVHESLPQEGGHYTASLASASCATDGDRVVAFFGSQGLFCLDFDGDVLWEKDLGSMHTKHGHGEGCSPVLSGDNVIVNWDHEEESFLVVLDKTTGNERWRRRRNEVTSWATPLVVTHDERDQIVVCGTDRVRSYDLATGEIIWECGGLSANIVASPVAANGMVYAGSSYDKKALLAIRLDRAQGDVSDSSAVVWKRIRGTPYVPSLLLYGDSLYFLGHYQNVLTRLHAPTGEERPGPMRLGVIGDVYASPVAAADRIYVTDRTGTTIVISHEDEPKLLAINRIDEEVNASIAIVGTELFLRSTRHLYCIGRRDAPSN